MGYFSNGTEGEVYGEQYCSRCVHGQKCPVMLLHLLHNYDECNNEESMLHVLIPRSKDGVGNEQCAMFFATDAARNQAQVADLTEADRKYLSGEGRA